MLGSAVLLPPASLYSSTMHQGTSSPPAPSSRSNVGDKEMNDYDNPISPLLLSPVSPPQLPARSKTSQPTSADDLAETVMNWDLGISEVRGTKRKPQTEEPEKEVKELVVKLQKLSHDGNKVDGVRCVHVKFAPGVILKAKKLFQEPWGTMVSALENYEAMDIIVGQKFWTRWDGETTPYTSLPIYHAVHSVADRNRTFVP